MHIRDDRPQPTGKKWICLVEVRARPNNDALGSAKGAFVTTVVFADGAEDFTKRLTHALADEGFDVVKIEDIGLFDERARTDDVAEEVASVAEGVSEQAPVGFGTFHSFDQ